MAISLTGDAALGRNRTPYSYNLLLIGFNVFTGYVFMGSAVGLL